MAKIGKSTGGAFEKTAGKKLRSAAGADRQLKIQTALFEIADAASAVTDMQSFYKRLHEIVGTLMYAKNFFIALYDENSDLISWPYHADVEDIDDASWGPQIMADHRGGTAYLIRNGQSVWMIRDYKRMLKSGQFDQTGPTSADFIGIPLKGGNKILGALVVQSYTSRHTYTRQDVEILSFVAQHISTALTRARAIEETRQRNSELAIINSVQEGLASKLDMQEIYELVGEKIRDTFNAQVVSIVTYDRAAQLMHGRYYFEDGQVLPGITLSSFGFRKHVVENCKPIIINEDMSRAMEEYDNPVVQGSQPKSAIFIPMSVDGEAMGVISLQNNDQEHAFTEADLRLLTTLSNSMSVALENARLFDETQQRNAELAILNSVGEAMAKTLDVKTVTKIVGDKVRDIFGADQVGILLLERQTNLLHLHYGYDKAYDRYVDDAFVKPIPLGKGLTSKVIELRQPLLFGTQEEKKGYDHYMPPELEGRIKMCESWLGVPIMVADRVLGAVLIEDYRPHAYNESHLRLLQTLSSNMGVAIQNARLFDETQQRNAELAIINSVQEGLASKLEMREIYDLVGDKIREIFDANTVTLATFDLEKNLMHPHYAIEKGRRFFIEPLPIPEVYREFIQRAQPLLINSNLDEYLQRLDPNARPLAGDMPKSVLAVPLMMNGALRGIITLQNIDRENVFSESDMRLLQTLANSMSVALENARLWEQEKLYRKALQRELEIGREIQAGFLPEALPQIEGWEIAASLMSAREVAGDFYDVFELPDGTIGLVIADVCDKGVGAALFMTLFRSLIRAASNLDYFEHTASDSDTHSPAERLLRAMSLTNNYIAETHEKSGMFATLFFGILDPRDGRLAYINGGHEPPLIIREGIVREILHKTGPAVGLTLDGCFELRETTLQAGEIFLAYTDGVPDCQSPRGDFYGRENLLTVLRNSNESSHELIKMIEADLRQHTAEATQFDDITLLAVRRGWSSQ